MENGLTQALQGVSVVALATNIPGPVAAARLVQWGARVTKIEPPHGDALALACPAWYEDIVTDMEVCKLDLRDVADARRLHEYLARADVLITAMRPAALSRAGVAWSDLQATYPRLSQVAVVGEGAPHADRAGHDLTYQARAGLLSPPALPRSVFADLAAAERAVSAALAAVCKCSRSGRGSYAEISIVDAAIAFARPLRYGLTAASGPLGGALPTYDLYQASDGWIAVAALEPHFFERLRTLLGVDALDAPTLAESFRKRRAAEWEELGSSNDIPLAAVTGACA
ncbi:MAG TPA: CoA transferase [Candidatus Baltobacteraceae bacterium]|nr:CoA transferase [Candidatus Baltobacteraceae bacterium]